jgi:vacuolar-type H+-ATPase subunit I/STV1
MKKGVMHETTYEVDIAAEFRDVKASIAEGNAKLTERLDAFKSEISGWKSVFDTQLSKLNSNMDKALSTIADHEARLTKIEEDYLKQQVQKQTVSEMSKLMFFIAKSLIGAGVIIGSVLGTAGAWKFLFPGA